MLGEEESGWAFLAVGAVAALTAWWLLARMRRPEARNAAPLLLFLGLVNGPMINSLREGNTTHIILLLLVLAFVLWRSGWDFVAGLLLGLCALIKLPLLLFGAYYILRGKWRVALGGVTSIATAVLLSLADYGLQGNIAWYKDSVEPFLGGVIPAFNVQSIDGFLIRLSTGAGAPARLGSDGAGRRAQGDPQRPVPARLRQRHLARLARHPRRADAGHQRPAQRARYARIRAGDHLGHRHQPHLLDPLLPPAAHSVGPLSR